VSGELRHTTNANASLRIEDLSKRFGGLRVFDGVSFELKASSVMGVIGPNGAGKTTMINLICGLLSQTSGKIWLGSQNISTKPFHVVSQMGVVRSFQQTNTFKSATVEENLYRAKRFSRGRPGLEVDLTPLIKEFGLDKHFSDESSSMPYGKQKMLGLLMALAPKPRFLLLDEPAAGLERKERTQIDRFVDFACEKLQCGVLIVEHDMDLVKRLCPIILVLESGRILAQGPPAEVLARKDVMEAYLGTDEE